MKMLFRLLNASLVSILIGGSCFAHDLIVTNNTPFSIKAKCERVGLQDTSWYSLAPNEKKHVSCGGSAACSKGIHVKILGASKGWKDVEFSTGWNIQCGDAEVSIIAVPKFNKEQSALDFSGTTTTIYTLRGFKFAIARDMEITTETLDFYCEPKI